MGLYIYVGGSAKWYWKYGILTCQPIYETKHAGERDYSTRDNYRLCHETRSRGPARLHLIILYYKLIRHLQCFESAFGCWLFRILFSSQGIIHAWLNILFPALLTGTKATILCNMAEGGTERIITQLFVVFGSVALLTLLLYWCGTYRFSVLKSLHLPGPKP